jgi:hypothetical protein
MSNTLESISNLDYFCRKGLINPFKETAMFRYCSPCYYDVMAHPRCQFLVFPCRAGLPNFYTASLRPADQNLSNGFRLTQVLAILGPIDFKIS